MAFLTNIITRMLKQAWNKYDEMGEWGKGRNPADVITTATWTQLTSQSLSRRKDTSHLNSADVTASQLDVTASATWLSWRHSVSAWRNDFSYLMSFFLRELNDRTSPRMPPDRFVSGISGMSVGGGVKRTSQMVTSQMEPFALLSKPISIYC